MQPGFQAFLGNFWDTLYRPCPEYCGATAWMQPDFQAFVGIFRQLVGTVCKPRLGLVVAAVGTQPYFQAFLGNLWAQYASNVRDASRPRYGRKYIFHQMKEAQSCQGRVRATAGMELDFQVILVQGSGDGDDEEKVVSGTRCAGHDRDALGQREGHILIFRHFWQVFGHDVQATSGTPRSRGRDTVRFSGICRQFVGTVCRPRSGRVLAAIGT
ncbi:Hypothetical predicted protein [Olea europaea subsp. europaea]|uniref:Uncharacterized protein n=1 Tax=Olea europaea subsp. europaea TaxID=158383 RepID=A0A8S0TZD5_OLEEU|nr:Hypothetical predicted protein [Olea europaea subsp. europaea]